MAKFKYNVIPSVAEEVYLHHTNKNIYDILGKNLIIVPARSGSKGLKNKNLRSFNGQPLIYWSIEAAHYIAGLLVD